MSELTPKQIYLGLAKKYSVCNELLITDLGEELFTAPATHMESYHGAFEGGLVNHLILVAKYAKKLNDLYPEKNRCSDQSVVKVALLCEIGKVGMFKPCTSDWHRKNQGKMYEYVDNLVSMRLGERSVHKIVSAGNILTESEYQAILNQDTNLAENPMINYHAEPLTRLLRQAIEIAIMDQN